MQGSIYDSIDLFKLMEHRIPHLSRYVTATIEDTSLLDNCEDAAVGRLS